MATTQSTQRARHDNLPFYALPRERKTSAEIVREARAAIRAIDTARPFSPVNEVRSPPSVSTASSNKSDSTGSNMSSRPLSSVKLAPLGVNKVPVQQDDKNLSEKLDQVLSSSKGSAKKRPKGSIPTCWYQEEGHGGGDQFSRLPSSGSAIAEKPEIEAAVSNSGSSGFESGNDSKLRGHDADFGHVVNSKLFQHKITMLLEQMDPSNNPEGADEKLYQSSLQLHMTLKEGRISGKNFPFRPAILKSVYRILDPRKPKLCLCLSKIIFLLKVTGKNLTSICKLLYKLARDESNDELFLDDEFLECFMDMYRALHPATNPNTLMYSTATIKLLALNGPLRLELSKLGCVEALSSQLEELNNMISQGETLSNYTTSILTQLLSAFRNLVESEENTLSFLHTSVIFEMCAMQEKCLDYPEIVLNFSKIFSKMTTRSEYCAEINNTYPQCYALLLHILKKYLTREDITIRICFALGNLIANDEKARYHLLNLQSSTETLLAILDHHLQLATKLEQERTLFASNLSLKFGTNEPFSQASEDVVLKVVRVLSNMTLDEVAGQQLADSHTYVLQLLKLLETKPFVDNAEVMEGTLVLLNNLTYYLASDVHCSSIFLTIVESLLPMLFQDHLELFVETCRVFGNLTRCQEVRDMIIQRKALPFLMQLLDSPSEDLIFAVCGALMNFLEDDDKKQTFAEEDGVVKLMTILHDLAPHNWPLGGLICQVLWNYTNNGEDQSCTLFTPGELNHLIAMLEHMLEKGPALNGNGHRDDSEQEKDRALELWQQCFYPAASELLDRLTGWVEKQTSL